MHNVNGCFYYVVCNIINFKKLLYLLDATMNFRS